MRAMSYQQGMDRSQTDLLPACLEDYVRADASVRFIEAFVEGLDSSLGETVERIVTRTRKFWPFFLAAIFPAHFACAQFVDLEREIQMSDWRTKGMNTSNTQIHYLVDANPGKSVT